MNGTFITKYVIKIGTNYVKFSNRNFMTRRFCYELWWFCVYEAGQSDVDTICKKEQIIEIVPNETALVLDDASISSHWAPLRLTECPETTAPCPPSQCWKPYQQYLIIDLRNIAFSAFRIGFVIDDFSDTATQSGSSEARPPSWYSIAFNQANLGGTDVGWNYYVVNLKNDTLYNRSTESPGTVDFPHYTINMMNIQRDVDPGEGKSRLTELDRGYAEYYTVNLDMDLYGLTLTTFTIWSSVMTKSLSAPGYSTPSYDWLDLQCRNIFGYEVANAYLDDRAFINYFTSDDTAQCYGTNQSLQACFEAYPPVRFLMNREAFSCVNDTLYVDNQLVFHTDLEHCVDNDNQYLVECAPPQPTYLCDNANQGMEYHPVYIECYTNEQIHTLSPTFDPSRNPSFIPTNEPTANPSSNPSVSPTTVAPTKIPTVYPSNHPTKVPSVHPTTNPSANPSETPSFNPSNSPSVNPTNNPSLSANPTKNPSNVPTFDPTKNPTNNPTMTDDPTVNPTSVPTLNPTNQPTNHPTNNPTTAPSMNPTVGPSQDEGIEPHTNNPSHSHSPTTTETDRPTENPTENSDINKNDAKSGDDDTLLIALIVVGISLCLFFAFLYLHIHLKKIKNNSYRQNTRKLLNIFNNKTSTKNVVKEGYQMTNQTSPRGQNTTNTTDNGENIEELQLGTIANHLQNTTTKGGNTEKEIRKETDGNINELEIEDEEINEFYDKPLEITSGNENDKKKHFKRVNTNVKAEGINDMEENVLELVEDINENNIPVNTNGKMFSEDLKNNKLGMDMVLDDVIDGMETDRGNNN